MACNLTAKEVERVCKYLSELLGEPVEFYQRAFGVGRRKNKMIFIEFESKLNNKLAVSLEAIAAIKNCEPVTNGCWIVLNSGYEFSVCEPFENVMGRIEEVQGYKFY